MTFAHVGVVENIKNAACSNFTKEQKMNNKSKGYDETLENASIRPQYESLINHWDTLSRAKKKTLFQKSKTLLSNDYPVHPMPRILTGSEFRTLQLGVKQRAEAIRAFLMDYYSFGKQWKKVIPPTVLHSITGQADHKGTLDPWKWESKYRFQRFCDACASSKGSVRSAQRNVDREIMQSD